MLTGPVTILQWSFVRDDQPRGETCKQIALAIRDEVLDLEKAGVKIIQIDEAALREGLPIRKSEWQAYLDWAVESFRLTAGGVKAQTQIHTHMCYSEFNDIIAAVAAMDADVISIETSRSAMELLDAFVSFKYPSDIGPASMTSTARACRRRKNGRPAQQGAGRAVAPAALGQSRLWAQDPRLEGSRAGADFDGRGGESRARPLGAARRPVA